MRSKDSGDSSSCLRAKRVSELSGVTVRTLHHYDRIGLFKPTRIGANGYRLYSPESLADLQQILFYKELGFPLGKIKELVRATGAAREGLLEKQKELLELKRDKLDRLVALIERKIAGDDEVSFAEFGAAEYARKSLEYCEEVRRRWKGTEQFADFSKRQKAADRGGDRRCLEAIAARMPLPADSEETQEAIRLWQERIGAQHYHCGDGALRELGRLYVEDERFASYLDSIRPGFARYLAEGIGHRLARPR